LQGQEVQIVLEDDNPIFRPYRLSEMEKALVQAWTTKLLHEGLVELLKGEYVSAIVMPNQER